MPRYKMTFGWELNGDEGETQKSRRAWIQSSINDPNLRTYGLKVVRVAAKRHDNHQVTAVGSKKMLERLRDSFSPPYSWEIRIRKV